MILLSIDDDPDDFMLFEEAVKHCDAGFECIHATDGLHALAMLDTFQPDLIFLDNNMPYMNGRETLRTIREKFSLVHLPVYMLSTYMPPRECEAFMNLGANGCLVKPGTFDELCARLKEVVIKHMQ